MQDLGPCPKGILTKGLTCLCESGPSVVLNHRSGINSLGRGKYLDSFVDMNKFDGII